MGPRDCGTRERGGSRIEATGRLRYLRQELRQAGVPFGGFAEVGEFGGDVGADAGLERDNFEKFYLPNVNL
jgi:hypothetical protein